MIERPWPDELQQILEAKFRALGSTLDQNVSPAGLRIGPPLTDHEAKYFILGMETGLFELDAEGYVETSLVTPPSAEHTKPKVCQIFNYDPPPLRLSRETICRFSTAAALILDRGWLQRQIQIAPSLNNNDAPGRGADLVVRSLENKLLAGVGVKRSAHELGKLRNDFYQCCRRGEHPEDNCGFPQNHGKFEFCAAFKPTYFWAVAPDGEVCFRMDYRENGTIQLEEMASLPPRSILELEMSEPDGQ